MKAALAVLPESSAAPRVIRQFTSTFLVDRHGQIWRVYDSHAVEDAERRMPSPSSISAYRLFIALARNAERRVHRFARGANRDIDADCLQAQLEASAGA